MGRKFDFTISYPNFYLDFGRTSLPFTINSGDSFMGFIPSGESSGFVMLDAKVTSITSLSFGFSAALVPESQSYAMFLIGLFLTIPFVIYRKAKDSNTAQC